MNKKIYLLLYALMLNMAVGFAQYNEGAYGFLNSTNSSRVAALGGTLVPIYDSDIQLDAKQLYNSCLGHSLFDDADFRFSSCAGNEGQCPFCRRRKCARYSTDGCRR